MPPLGGHSGGKQPGGSGGRGKGKGKWKPEQWNVWQPQRESPVEQEKKSEELKAKLKNLPMTRQNSPGENEGPTASPVASPKSETAASPQDSKGGKSEAELERKAQELKKILIKSGLSTRPLAAGSERPSGPAEKPASERAGGMGAQSSVLTVSQFAAQAATAGTSGSSRPGSGGGGSQSPAAKAAQRTSVLPDSVDLTEGSSPNVNRPPWKAAPKPKQQTEGIQDLSMQEKMKSRAERFAKTGESSVPAAQTKTPRPAEGASVVGSGTSPGAPGSMNSSPGVPGTGSSSSARGEPAMGPPSRPASAPPSGAPPPRGALPGTSGYADRSSESPRGKGMGPMTRPPMRSPAAVGSAPSPRGVGPGVPHNAPTRPVAPLQTPQQVPHTVPTRPVAPLQAPQQWVRAGMHGTSPDVPLARPPAGSHETPAAGEQTPPPRPALVGTPAQKNSASSNTTASTAVVASTTPSVASIGSASTTQPSAGTEKKVPLNPTTTDKKIPQLPASTEKKAPLITANGDKKAPLIPDKKTPPIPASTEQKAQTAQPGESGQAMKRPAPISRAAAPTGSVRARSEGLVRALAKLNAKEPPRKKPKLTEGEDALWEEEYRRLASWMEANLPAWPMYSKPGATKVMKYTNEKAEFLEKYLRDVSAPAP